MAANTHSNGPAASGRPLQETHVKLYTVPLAPNPTKVMLYLAERAAAGADLGIEQVIVNTLKGRHKEPEHLARNPFGTLPVLELNDGTFLTESLVIIDYLEDRYPDGALHAATPEARAHARDLERVIELKIANPAGGWVHATNSPLGFPADPDRAAALQAGMQPALDHLEALLADGRPLLTGAAVAVADCTLAAALQFVRFAKGDLIGARPALRDWDARYRERPAARTVLKW